MKKKVLFFILFLFSFSVYAYNYNGVEVPGGLTYYSFDNSNTSSTVANDSWSTNDGTINTLTTGIDSSSCIVGECVNNTMTPGGDPGTTSMTFPDLGITSGLTDYSYSVWVNARSLATNQLIIQTGHEYHGAVSANSDAFQGFMVISGANTVTTATASTNTWYHVVKTYSTTEGQKIYLNGVLNDTDATTGASGALTASNVIGCDRNGNNQFGGLIDEVAFYNYSLNSTQVEAIYDHQLNGYRLDVSSSTSSNNTPKIDNSTYNMSSAFYVGDQGNWRNGNESGAILTRDTTPTVRFDTDINAYCRINTEDQNWTTMGGNRNCTTTGSTNHVCTLSVNDALEYGSGYNSLYVGCIDSSFAFEGENSTSGSLNVSLDLYNMIGTTKYINGTVVENAVVVLTDQNTNVSLDNVLSNSTGGWDSEVYSGTWSACWAWTIGSSTQNTTCASNIAVP